jgi:hypothetical protein
MTKVLEPGRPSPGGTAENSPALQRWEKGKAEQMIQVPEGRPKIARRFSAGSGFPPPGRVLFPKTIYEAS